MVNQVNEGIYQGEKAIIMEYGPYQATLLPEIGGNLISFRDIDRDYRFLREPKPEEMDSFKERPMVHGIPVLFPPNRYEDGTFTLNGQTYQFPVNEEETHNHLHGFFYNRPWNIEDYGTAEQESYIVIRQGVHAGHEAYQFFPHTFSITIRYSLSDQGLQQKVNITNKGEEAMPCMLAFHTAINAPFAKNSTEKDCTYTATIGKRWELTERMLPTGEYQPLSQKEERIKNGGISPFFEEMDNHYTARPQNGRNYMALTDSRQKVRLIYDVGTKYKQWMIWNNFASGEFFCPEPQINTVNAPNLHLPEEETGLVMLGPGESWSEISRMHIEIFE